MKEPSLAQNIEDLFNSIGTGINDSTLRNRLSTIKEQAEAFEARFKELDTRVKELEAQTPSDNREGDQDRLKEEVEKILRLLFEAGRSLSIEQMAGNLGMATGIADYHMDTLDRLGMVELAAITPGGTMYFLTPKGRAYVVENNLV
jgi:hypothetical protein